MKKVLFVATVVKKHIMAFHIPYLEWFNKSGYEVHVAAKNDYENKEECHIPFCDKFFDLPFERSPLKKNNFYVYRELKRIVNSNKYKIIHCHTPMGGVIGRLAARNTRKKGTKVIYTAHGFHFFKGAPILNWLVYYPIEKLLSRFTDVLITINDEDYNLSINRKFKANKIEHVKGVGVNINKFSPQTSEKKQKLRRTYNYTDKDFILIYVGELSYRKHQDFLISAVSVVKRDIPNIKLLLVGEGDLYGDYKKLITLLRVENNVELLGYRRDVPDLMSIADVAVSSSRQEGLPVNVMEAMAVGLPLVVSNSRGNRDLVINGKNGIVVELDNVNELSNALVKLYKSEELRKRYGAEGLAMINNYSLENILKKMKCIYSDLL